jgi:hypothetical protein
VLVKRAWTKRPGARLAAAGAALLAAGCGAGGADGGAAAPGNEAANAAAAEAKAQEEVALVETAGLLPPRADIVSRQPVEGAIAFDFRTPEAPDRLAAWYRAPQPGGGFEVTSELTEGTERVLSGTTRRPPGDFSVRLAPDAGGGTTAMVLVTLRR